MTMAEYIDRDAIYKAFANACTDVLERASEIEYIAGFSYELVIEILDNIPAADVAPVVRCKDCEHFDRNVFDFKGFKICPASGMYITPEDYCSYAERKET